MTVQELFKLLDIDYLAKSYIYYSESSIGVDRIKSLISELRGLDISPIPNNIIFSIPQLTDKYLNSYLIKKEDLDKEKIESYAYEFSPMETILGYEVSKACIHYLGEYRMACSILYEMTFFGNSVLSQKINSSSFSKELKEQIEDIKNQNAELKSLDEDFGEYGWKDSRSKAEKEFDKKLYRAESSYKDKIKKYLYKLERDLILTPNRN